MCCFVFDLCCSCGNARGSICFASLPSTFSHSTHLDGICLTMLRNDGFLCLCERLFFSIAIIPIKYLCIWESWELLSINQVSVSLFKLHATLKLVRFLISSKKIYIVQWNDSPGGRPPKPQIRWFGSHPLAKYSQNNPEHMHSAFDVGQNLIMINRFMPQTRSLACCTPTTNRNANWKDWSDSMEPFLVRAIWFRWFDLIPLFPSCIRSQEKTTPASNIDGYPFGCYQAPFDGKWPSDIIVIV